MTQKLYKIFWRVKHVIINSRKEISELKIDFFKKNAPKQHKNTGKKILKRGKDMCRFV